MTVNIWYTHFVILIWFALKVIFRQRDPPGNCYVLCEGTCIAQRKLGLPCWSGHQIHDIGWQHVIFVRKSMWCVNDLSLNDHISHIQHKIPMNIMVVSDVILHISSSHWNVIIPCYPPIFRHHCGSGLMSTSAAKRWILQIPNGRLGWFMMIWGRPWSPYFRTPHIECRSRSRSFSIYPDSGWP